MIVLEEFEASRSQGTKFISNRNLFVLTLRMILLHYKTVYEV